jgi:hypothetical protein
MNMLKKTQYLVPVRDLGLISIRGALPAFRVRLFLLGLQGLRFHWSDCIDHSTRMAGTG